MWWEHHIIVSYSTIYFIYSIDWSIFIIHSYCSYGSKWIRRQQFVQVFNYRFEFIYLNKCVCVCLCVCCDKLAHTHTHTLCNVMQWCSLLCCWYCVCVCVWTNWLKAHHHTFVATLVVSCPNWNYSLNNSLIYLYIFIFFVLLSECKL